jgi:two-component system, LytTR family, response regulator
MKLRAIVVDDEFHARENMKYLLENFCPEIEVVGLASDEKTALQVIQEQQPQVVFLDICMPSGTEGFDLLDAVTDKNFQVVFVTAFKEYAIQALNANAIHYLLKPVDIDDLRTAVKKLVGTSQLFSESGEQLQNYIRSLENLTKALQPGGNISRITIHHARGFKIVDPAELMYLEGDGNYTSIIFTDGVKYVDTRSIGVYENVLRNGSFFRIHKSHIINLLYVKEFLNDDGHFVIMKDSTKLAVSRLRVPGFLELFRPGGKIEQVNKP